MFVARSSPTCDDSSDKNNLSGTLPRELGSRTKLEFVSLSEGTLYGKIPSSFGDLDRLQLLNLHSNSLTGELPETLLNLKNLAYLLKKYLLLAESGEFIRTS